MKNLIIMSLAFFALALVGCNKETEEDKCNKKEGKEWKDGKCVNKTDDGEPEVVDTEAKCDAKGGTHKWLAEKPAEGEQCVAKTEAECNATTPAGKVEWKDGKCAVKEAAKVEYSVTNRIEGRTLVVASGTANKELAKDACVLVGEDQVAALKVSVKAVAASGSGATVVQAQAEEVLCDGSETPAVADNDCKKSAVTAQAKAPVPTTGNKNQLVSHTANASGCTDKLSAPAAS